MTTRSASVNGQFYLHDLNDDHGEIIRNEAPVPGHVTMNASVQGVVYVKIWPRTEHKFVCLISRAHGASWVHSFLAYTNQ